MDNFAMDWQYGIANDGNIAMMGEVDLTKGLDFTLAVAMGYSRQSATTQLIQAFVRPFECQRAKFNEQWKRTGLSSKFKIESPQTAELVRLSQCVLMAHEDKMFSGATVASMSIPWGETKDDSDQGGYHLVWARDMMHSTTAMLASGEIELPLRALTWLPCVQGDDGNVGDVTTMMDTDNKAMAAYTMESALIGLSLFIKGTRLTRHRAASRFGRSLISLKALARGSRYELFVRSRLADEQHPFGYGGELYFWSLIVAVLIFGVGGGISMYEGVLHLLHPVEVTSVMVSYTVLGMAVIFEGITWMIAWHEFSKTRQNKTVWQSIRGSKDPTTFMVLFEDTAALLGLVVAFLGLLLSQLFDSPYFDGATSLLIGLILATVASVLILETRGLLIGESADPATVAGIRSIINSEVVVDRAGDPLTLHLGADQILVAVDIEFRDDLTADEVATAIERLERSIRQTHPRVKQIFLEARRNT